MKKTKLSDEEYFNYVNDCRAGHAHIWHKKANAAKLTAEQVKTIRACAGTAKDLADIYQVSLSTIYNVRNGTTYGRTK